MVRDVLQSHLTEVLALVAMDMPESLTDVAVNKAKINFLKKVGIVWYGMVCASLFLPYPRSIKYISVNYTCQQHYY